ncbi:MAG: hypothetical protein JNL02_10715 [Saprospiraceae bacterium]|nr:hypothetical protein [Saprospiraceae bacterium]
MTSCLDFIETWEHPQQRAIMQLLHELITGFPGVVPKLRYKLPFYDRNRWLCYLNPTKDGGIEWGVCQAYLLSNEQGLLDFRNRTQVASATFYHPREVPAESILEILQEMMIVDDEKRGL